MKKIFLFILTFLFFWISQTFADSWSFDLTSEWNLAWNETYKIWTLIISDKSNLYFDYECWDNDLNWEIRIYLSWTTFYRDCHETLNNDYVSESWYWKNVEPWTYELYWINTQSKNWNWWFGKLNFTSRRIATDEPGWTGWISQTFIDLDLTSFDYKPQLISANVMTGEVVMIDYSIPLSNMNKNLYEIKILVMIIGLFHLMWIFYTYKNDLLWKS